MKFLSLLTWVGQFGFSILFPLCFFLWLGAWLQNKYGLGTWIIIPFGILGFLTSVRTAYLCLRAMRHEAERLYGKEYPPAGFNDYILTILLSKDMTL